MSYNIAPNRTAVKEYKYTHPASKFTKEQRDFYEENGFIMIRKLVSDEIIDECRQRFVDICNGKADPGSMTIMKDQSLKGTGVQGEFLINKIQDFLQDDVFFKYACDKGILDVVENILGPNITAMHSMLINKPPDSTYDASRHPLHQDLHYFPFRPADRIAASWTAMERIDEKNGCLFAVPGSHKGELFKHDYPKLMRNKAYHGVFGMDHLPIVNLVMEKGDTVFFHPILLHGSGPNLTKGFRKAISCHFSDSFAQFIEVKGTTQENIAEEVETMASKRGLTVPFQMVWKLKSRCVRGEGGNFANLESHL